MHTPTETSLSKVDIENLRKEVKIDITRVEEKIEHFRKEVTIEIVKSKNSLLMWLVPIMIGQVAATVGFVKLLLMH